MLKSYFIIAIRNFVRDRTYTIINLSGLAVGLASVLLIIAYVRYELSYDKHYSNSDRVYRLVAEKNKNGVVENSVMLPQPLSNTLKNEFPEIESVTQLGAGETEFIINNDPVKLKTIDGDSSFFDVFDLPFIYGNGKTAMDENDNIVITEKVANTFFPGQNPVGKYLKSKGFRGKIISFKITGVIQNIPGNTHFTAGVIIANTPKQEALDWRGYSAVPQYVLLKKNASINSLQKKIVSIYDKYNFPKGELKISFQAVTSIHLHSNIADEPFANSDIKYIYVFSFVAVIILLIGCINYINLTTARSLQRVREVGVRKVIGAEKKQLAFQFISESVLFFICTLPFALLIAYSLWPLFMKVVNIEATENYLLNTKFIITIICAGVITGALSGLYPALFLSSLPAAHILKGSQKGFRINMNLRRALIVFQFMISVALIISTVIIYMQLHLLNNMELGFNKNNLIALPGQNFRSSVQTFKNELKENKNVEDVTIASWHAGERYGASSSMDNPTDTTKEMDFAFVDADFDFLKTMQIPLLQGRNFSANYAADLVGMDSLFKLLGKGKLSPDERMKLFSSQSIILTEQTVKALQLKKPLAGQVLNYGALHGTVIGEAKDFLGISLLRKTPLVIIRAGADMKAGYPYVRISSQNIRQTIAFIQTKWKKFFPESSFDFSFVDERLQQSYDSETRLASMFNCFAVLAITIATLGLFSLVALTVKQKTKEIGIRKILGASVMQIVRLLSVDFFKLVLVAILIAVPVSWWCMHEWLSDFSYRITISWWIFLIAASGCLCFAIAVVVIQSRKAAAENPVKSLRTE
ncbi:MAG TPA: FtsX-like permease family protein [Puia sp.]|nr:FtsX-like permease family protein [Puia sp.]